MSDRLPDAPIAVLDVDRSELGSVPVPARDGSPYNGAFVLVREYGRPAGIVTTALAENNGSALDLTKDAEFGQRPTTAPLTPSAPPTTMISCVICTVDDGESATRCVRSILEGSYEHCEVIVVNNRPATSKLRETLARDFPDDPRVRYHEEARPGLSAARNSGASVARGDVIAFTDDDVVADRNWLASIAAIFEDRSVDCVTGMILPLKLETDAQWLLERFAGFAKGFEVTRFTLEQSSDDPLFPFAAGRFGSGANISLRRESFAKLGGFDPVLGTGTKARGGEDLDAFIRLMMEGGTLVYEPASIVWHEHRDGMEDLRAELFGYGVGLAAVITKHMAGRYRSRLLRRIPGGLRLMFDPGSPKNARKGTDFPRILTWRERLGAISGPYGYLRSRIDAAAFADTASPTQILAETGFEPIWVAAVTLDEPAVEKPVSREIPAENYKSARLLVRDAASMPVGFVNVQLSHGGASEEVVRAAIETQLGSASPSAQLPLPRPERMPKMSVVICTFDRPDSLLRAVASVLASDHPDFELVIVDNAPDRPATREALEQIDDPRVRYEAEPRVGLSAARNRGLAAAGGELIAFTDDDVEVDPGWLSALAAAFAAQPKVGLVTGLVPAAELDNEFQQRFDAAVHWSTELTRRSYDLGRNRMAKPTFPFRTGRMGAGANFAVSRECARAVGEFDTALGAGAPCGGGDDLDYFLRVIQRGWTLSYEPSALVWHHHRADSQSLLRQVAAYGSGATAYAFKHAFNPLNLLTFMRSVLAWMTSPVQVSSEDVEGRAAGPWHTHGGASLPSTPMDRKLKSVWRRGAWLGPLLYLKGRLR